MVIDSPGNGPESAQIVSVNDLHVNAPQVSLIMEIAPGPQKGEE